MASNVYSLASVRVSLNNPTLLNDQGIIEIGGTGKLMGSIGYSFDNPLFSKQTTADGGVVFTHNKSKAGDITITIKQSSPTIKALIEYIKLCDNDPQNAGATITCIDVSGNICFVANDVFPQKIPDNTGATDLGDRTFVFLAGEIIPDDIGQN